MRISVCSESCSDSCGTVSSVISVSLLRSSRGSVSMFQIGMPRCTAISCCQGRVWASVSSRAGWLSSSISVSRCAGLAGSMGTYMAPSRRMASISAMLSGRRDSSIATRSPAPTFIACRRVVWRTEMSCSVSYVQLTPFSPGMRTASAFGWRWHCSSKRSMTVACGRRDSPSVGPDQVCRISGWMLCARLENWPSGWASCSSSSISRWRRKRRQPCSATVSYRPDGEPMVTSSPAKRSEMSAFLPGVAGAAPVGVA